MRLPAKEKITVGVTKLKRFLRHNVPKKRNYGKSLSRCLKCGGVKRHISKYKLNICGRCFKESAKELGFKKLS